MKLLNSYVSPFAARVRLAIYAYDLPVAIAPSGQWRENFEKSPDYLAINPVGRVPTLILQDGSALPESSIIVEYLADAFPHTGLRPGPAAENANARLLAQLAELYLQAPSGPLFGLIFSGQRGGDRARSCLAAMDDGLRYLDHFTPNTRSGRSDAITVADCALVPFLFYAERMAQLFAASPMIARHPRLDAYWRTVKAHPASIKVTNEIQAALVNSPLKALASADGSGAGAQMTKAHAKDSSL